MKSLIGSLAIFNYTFARRHDQEVNDYQFGPLTLQTTRTEKPPLIKDYMTPGQIFSVELKQTIEDERGETFDEFC